MIPLRQRPVCFLLASLLLFTSSTHALAPRINGFSSPGGVTQRLQLPPRDHGSTARRWMAAADDDINKFKEDDEEEKPSKEDLFKAVGETMRQQKQGQAGGAAAAASDDLLSKINPFKAGRNLRKSIDDALKGISAEAETTKEDSVYYIHDRVFDDGKATAGLSLEDRLVQDDYVPEVLVVGATGEVGALVVRRLLQEQGRFRVRVLVADLYTRTLNQLGTGVTYCQGDLNNVDSLEYALTDVDKIIFCASPPKPDEEDFRNKFREYVQETLREDSEAVTVQSDESSSDEVWERLDSVLQVRAQLAEQVDCIGMKNAVTAYQHVRHADYGTSQAAKRTLFKFEGRPQDFNLFSVDNTNEDDEDSLFTKGGPMDSFDDGVDKEAEFDDDEYRDYTDTYGQGSLEQRRGGKVQTQVQWLRNKFGHAVFVGRLPKATADKIGEGEAAVISSRLRSREDPDDGIDLSSFGGLIARLCADGGTYEAFVRTGLYESDGIEYVCEFSTSTKTPGYMKSKNKFTTVRLPFQNYQPVACKLGSKVNAEDVPVFRGTDVRNLGFRYRSAKNRLKEQSERGEKAKFYLALSYIKLYRAQPEPEFVYVSDARIPPSVKSSMVRHDSRQLVAAGAGEESDVVQLLDESRLQAANDSERTEEEVYYKFRGEDILRKSGLAYSIIRVMNFNESPTGEASTIDLKSSNDEVLDVSRAEVAQICVSALMDPKALNKSFYVSKQGSASSSDEDISLKFSALPADAVA